MKKFGGIIDACGLEGFVPQTRKNISYSKIRAACNKHRDAVAYEVKVDKKAEAEIKKLIEMKRWEAAGELVRAQKTYKEIG